MAEQLLSRYINFFENVEQWSPDDYIIRFFDYAQGYVVSQFPGYEGKRNQATIEDLKGVAVESLVLFARNGYPEWVRQNGGTYSDPRMFWTLCRRRINWDIATWIEQQTSSDDTTNGHAETDDSDSRVFTQIAQKKHQDHSMLPAELAARFGTLDDTHQAILALYYFEEMQWTDAADILGVPRTSLNRLARRAEGIMLQHAASLVASGDRPQAAPAEVWPLDRFDAWARKTYGAPGSAYLEYVRVCLRLDVSYLVDILRASYGDRIKRMTTGRAALRGVKQFTDDQVREIRRRIAEGEMQKDIAADLNVSADSIGAIKRGRSYQYVA